MTIKSWERRLVFALAMWMGLSGGFALAEGHSVARIGDSGKFIELEFQAGGKVQRGLLPLYHVEGGRYFSAGVGIDERAAEYPPFALKLVFTAGGKPFLAGVDVTIQSADGGAAMQVPGEQVEGPWLFVDLEPGIYDISATHAGRTQGLKGIKVEGGTQKTVHLRWPDDVDLAKQPSKD